ncbi:MAG: rhamnogalacturonan acetylesterase [Ignavibacteriales bacterium]|nr:rhamnogalacturonan acetylesterase [Ignavibacteriales bacterium]
MQIRQRLLILTVILTLTLLLPGFFVESSVRVFLIGDSTMADKPVIGTAERGWGQVFPLFFGDDVLIENHARNGRSTKSFIAEGRWQTVCEKLKPGDWVFIQFGHNDPKKEDTSRYAEPRTDYKKNLLRFVNETRSKGAHPILLTPVSRRKFDKEGKLVDTHGEYPGIVREVAADEKVPLIDLHKKSMQLIQKMGPDESRKDFLWVKPGFLSAYPAGKEDDTHFTESGALKIARLIADDLQELKLPLSKSLRPFDANTVVGINKMVVLDQFYNNEWKKNAKGVSERFHYVWHDTANSGFSILGSKIVNLGASLDTLSEAPTPQNLRRASMYIIVDPDTPLETERPNYMDDAAAEAIADWVKNGGILVLMENDKGNAEFEHFNKLPEKFGIHFNEDSRNKVTGNAYDMGKFDVFPDHPMFKGLKKIYMKEVSTLTIESPASAVLTDHGDVIIAYAKVGKGGVFAVGDPWLYNEYIEHRKLPVEFENDKAAENLFRWLLGNASPVLAF